MARTVHESTRVVLRPIGNPLPLGFLALAAATLVLAGVQLGSVPAGESANVALILIGFVFPLQLLAAVLGFLARDVVAGTGMGVLAGTWLAVGLITLRGEPGATSEALGMLLLVAALALLVPTTVAVLGKLVAAAVLGTTALRLGTTGVYELTGATTWQEISGAIGLGLCALALYTALAMALEDARRQTVLPLGRRGRGADSVRGNLDDQLEGIEREAGVREQL